MIKIKNIKSCPKHINSRKNFLYFMKSIYELMEEDWETYCLMAGIALIEEISKPSRRIIRKLCRGKIKDYRCYCTLRLKMVDKVTIKKWFDITKSWEKKLGLGLMGFSFNGPKKERYSGQYQINFTPCWLYEIFKVCKNLPSEYTNFHCLDRLKNWRISSGKLKINPEEIEQWSSKISPYSKLLTDKYLAAGAFIVTFDLEARGITTGKVDLCMSEKYKDFLEFKLDIANNFGWSTKNKLRPVKVDYSRNLGIKATPQFTLNIKTKKLVEIHELAGPLVDPYKEKCLRFHVERIKQNKKTGVNGKTKQIILNTMRDLKQSTSTELQFYVNVRTDVVLDHLHALEKEGHVSKIRKGKKYIWSYKNADKCNS